MKTVFLIPCPLSPNTENASLPMGIREVILKTDVYLVENVRTARRFISSLKTGRVIEELEFYVLDKKTSRRQVEDCFSKIQAENVGVISEAGCPGVADPGALAVAYAHERGYLVRPLVGPSSILLALMGSGFNGQSFTFNGYLPIDKSSRKKAIHELENASRKATQIFMETPFRNNQLVESLLENLSIDTKLCIACNITGDEEFIITKTVGKWKTQVPDLHKKPVMFLIGN